jgi:hypothetical protein
MKRAISCFLVLVVVAVICARLYAQCTVTLPSIVYSHAWTAQTASISQYTMFTPSANGLYRLTLAGIADGTGNGSNMMEINTYVTWGTGASDYVSCVTQDYTYDTPHSGVVCAFEGANGVPVTFQANLQQIGTGGTFTGYDEYVTVEQLQ